ncbi:DUF1016 N-terminal domain-containing protein [Oerskovia sp. KBS0722]|uniref:DUF1016 N-terminal domain-containing protein n=1 Tax=Oerskovia sp. KBS0722 TaxID=1179673 RepID=UPI00210FABB1|nr:DUF1016 N-terminal domain-containing protein [Oerskovia sp. KBS0722]
MHATRIRAARAVNSEVLRLYWSVGHEILERQQVAGWGSKVIDRLAADLRREFLDQRGWSPSNLKNMRRIAELHDGADARDTLVESLPVVPGTQSPRVICSSHPDAPRQLSGGSVQPS